MEHQNSHSNQYHQDQDAKANHRELHLGLYSWRTWIWWEKWLEKLNQLKFEISRCIRPSVDEDTESEIHIFCAALEKAVAYLRTAKKWVYLSSKIIIVTRVAPKKTTSKVKLESEARKDSKDTWRGTEDSWSNEEDSDAHVYVIGNEQQLCTTNPFVIHRIEEIQTPTEAIEWIFVSGQLNTWDWAKR